MVTPDGMMRVLEQVPEYVITVETPHEHSTLEQMLATRAQMVRDGPQLMIASLISRDCLPHQFETVRAPRLGRSSIHACMQVLTMARRGHAGRHDARVGASTRVRDHGGDAA